MHRIGGFVFCVLFVFVAVVNGQSQSENENQNQSEHKLRQWNAKNGKFSVQARFVAFDQGKVKLLKEDGEELTVAIAKLSLDDHLHVSAATGTGRAWHSSKGKLLYVATFEAMANQQKARLISIAGKKLNVKLSKLDQDSRQFIKDEIQRRLNGPPPGAATTVKVPMDVEQSDGRIRKLIADCTRIAGRIRIDGRGGDWNGLPVFTSGVSHKQASLDIQQVAIAPRAKDLVVMIRTRGRPSADPFAFFVKVDVFGRQAVDDFQIGLSSVSDQRIKVYDEAGDSAKTVVDEAIGGIDVAIGEVVEARIPWSVIESAFPKTIKGNVHGPDARPFVRVKVLAFDRQSRSIVDYGPAVASFRFLPHEYPLDDSPPGKDRKTFPISVPFEGRWLVGHGAMGYTTHAWIHAYDFYIVDHQGSPTKVRQSTDNEEYYTYERPMLSPMEGRVVQVTNDQPDNPARDQQSRRANRVIVAATGNESLRLSMLHFRQGSAVAKQGQLLRPGDNVALAGNSGRSGWSHLHLEMHKSRPPRIREQARDNPFTIPLAIDKALVSLNPVPDDPWIRYVEDWEIRACVFVEAAR